MGSGTEGLDSSQDYLTPPGQADPDTWTKMAGNRGAQRLLEVAEVEPPTPVAKALGLSDTEKAVVRRRLMLLDDRPAELTDSYYPSSIARGTTLVEPGKIKGGAVRALADLGFAAHDVLEDVSVRPATAEEARQLGLPDEAVVLALFRVVLAEDGTPFEVSTMTMNPEGRHLRYRIRMG
ncbi:UTRA domain-containing protein [Nocardiopsis sp. RSe5-2]|uniref:UTRA domain-containing protein n=1 Tax=Nocardiopsis endophytica TaxID=3018445 RepID=A0ABT4TZ04_9ACTN|nr:UTRA domain-containing protein [Nocardiopsis endophytica]MDA2809936.1 UTRA domain-containing protein [Nocardiopsis endophytica]